MCRALCPAVYLCLALIQSHWLICHTQIGHQQNKDLSRYVCGPMDHSSAVKCITILGRQADLGVTPALSCHAGTHECSVGNHNNNRPGLSQSLAGYYSNTENCNHCTKIMPIDEIVTRDRHNFLQLDIIWYCSIASMHSVATILPKKQRVQLCLTLIKTKGKETIFNMSVATMTVCIFSCMPSKSDYNTLWLRFLQLLTVFAFFDTIIYQNQALTILRRRKNALCAKATGIAWGS